MCSSDLDFVASIPTKKWGRLIARSDRIEGFIRPMIRHNKTKDRKHKSCKNKSFAGLLRCLFMLGKRRGNSSKSQPYSGFRKVIELIKMPLNASTIEGPLDNQ